MGVYLSKPIKEKVTEEGSGPNFDYVSASMQGWRTAMEDAHISDVSILGNGLSLFAVFDGHGGKEVAKYCKKYFPNELKSNQSFIEKNYEQALIETFLKMDVMLETPEGKKELYILADKGGPDLPDDIPESQAGCTANVVLMDGDVIYVANAGDSRSVMCGEKNKYKELSKDHKPDDQKEKDRIYAAGGTVVDGRVNANLNLSRAIGDLEFKSQKERKPEEQLIISYPDVIKYTRKPDDRFLLMGCDGIWEMLPICEMTSFINDQLAQNMDYKFIIEELLERLLAKDTQGAKGLDNMSAILIVFKK